MGLVSANTILENPPEEGLIPVEVLALADSGAVHLCIPGHLRIHLKPEEIDRKVATLANGEKRLVSYVSPIQIRFKNRAGFSGALVMRDQVLFGANPMEDMDLMVLPEYLILDVNPASPNRAPSWAK
jgi:hypothetical protein